MNNCLYKISIGDQRRHHFRNACAGFAGSEDRTYRHYRKKFAANDDNTFWPVCRLAIGSIHFKFITADKIKRLAGRDIAGACMGVHYAAYRRGGWYRSRHQVPHHCIYRGNQLGHARHMGEAKRRIGGQSSARRYNSLITIYCCIFLAYEKAATPGTY